jgi:hypothetical protein
MSRKNVIFYPFLTSFQRENGQLLLFPSADEIFFLEMYIQRVTNPTLVSSRPGTRPFWQHSAQHVAMKMALCLLFSDSKNVK